MIDAILTCFAVLSPPAAGVVIHFLSRAGPRASKIASVGAIIVMASALCALLALFPRASVAPLDIHVMTVSFRAVNLVARFHVDLLALIPACACMVLGLVSMVYSLGYLSRANCFYPGTNDVDFAGTRSLMLVLAGGMLAAFMASDLVILAISWEVVNICTYLLVGHRFGDLKTTPAALKCFVMTHVGSVAFVILLVITGTITGTTSIDTIGVSIPAGSAFIPVLVSLLLVSAMPKAVQYPFHTWLPDATVAPTPALIMFHEGGAQVAIYVLVRFLIQVLPAHLAASGNLPGSVMLGDGLSIAGLALTIAGSVTVITGSTRALAETTLKRVVAWQAISELGLVVMMIGVSSPLALVAGLFQLVSHAIIASLMLLCSGAIMHATGRDDMSGLHGLHVSMPVTTACFLTCALAVSCVPLLSEFAGKVMMIHTLVESRSLLFLAIVVLGSVIHVAVSMRFFFATFLTPPRDEHSSVSDPPASMLVPMVFLASLVVFLGIQPMILVGLAIMPALAQAGVVGSPVEMTATIQTRIGFLDPVVLLAVLAVLAFLFHVTTRRRASISNAARMRALSRPFLCGDDESLSTRPGSGDLYHVFSSTVDLGRWLHRVDPDCFYTKLVNKFNSFTSTLERILYAQGKTEKPVARYIVSLVVATLLLLLAR